MQPDKNEAPVVDAGTTITAETDTVVTLQGSATDADSAELSYVWEQVAGTAVSITDANAAVAQFTAPSVEGEMSFSLTATDDLGAVGSDEVTVNVVAPAPAPAPVVSVVKSGGGGCTVAGGNTTDSSLTILLLISGVLMARRRYRFYPHGAA